MIIKKDIVILGGGIAGLWLLNRLQAKGFHAILLEQTALGHGQSIASQGMIHGGIKYALAGSLTGASEAIADMPRLWKQCLAGEGDVDLRGANILSDNYYMWPRNSVRSRFNAFFGSKVVRGKVDKLTPEQVPDFFKSQIKGPLYQLQDLVLDVPSLLATLAKRCQQWIYKIDWSTSQLKINERDEIEAITLPDGSSLQADRFIVTSGEGADFFLQKLGQARPQMQVRPLQMVVVKHQIKEPVYVHCVADQLTATPELTITTHRCKDGQTAWYLGGELAESGVDRSEAQQIDYSRDKLAELFPWCDLSQASFHGFRINRAEARQADGKRPDKASVLAHQNILLCWPTKLTLAPNLANEIIGELEKQNICPAAGDNIPLSGLPTPVVATTPWDNI